jgi:3-polyprenyl-4-hydroxybenzoate decarboxylase
MAYRDLRYFVVHWGRDLKRVVAPVDPKLEMTAPCGRALRAHSPALLFRFAGGVQRRLVRPNLTRAKGREAAPKSARNSSVR